MPLIHWIQQHEITRMKETILQLWLVQTGPVLPMEVHWKNKDRLLAIIRQKIELGSSFSSCSSNRKTWCQDSRIGSRRLLQILRAKEQQSIISLILRPIQVPQRRVRETNSNHKIGQNYWQMSMIEPCSSTKVTTWKCPVLNSIHRLQPARNNCTLSTA